MPGTQWELEQSLDAMNEGQTELEKGKLELSTQLSTAAAQLAMGQAQLDAAYEQFEASRDQAFQEAGLDGVLTTEMLSGILTASHFSMPAGYLDEDGASTLVKVGDRFGSLEELEGLLLMDVGLGDLGPVYLRDVADIRITDNAGESYARVNGNPGMILSIAKQSMYSTNDVSAALNGAMNELMEGDPRLASDRPDGSGLLYPYGCRCRGGQSAAWRCAGCSYPHLFPAKCPAYPGDRFVYSHQSDGRAGADVFFRKSA